jgi:hypothetical protein
MIGAAVCAVFHAEDAEANNGKYLLVWTGDVGTDDHVQDPDFLATIDADPHSLTYGKVLQTAALPCIRGAHLLDELGLVPGVSSCVLNEAHHMTDELWVDPHNGHSYLFVAGLISANIFRFDVTDPLHIPPATLLVTSRDVHAFAGTDDLHFLPNGNILSTFMGSKGLATPGGLVEFSPFGPQTFLAEYSAVRPGGPQRYVTNIDGVNDTGLLAHPHGVDLRPDLDLVVTSDYADPLSLALIGPTNQAADFGTTVRFWKMSNLAAGPQRIVQVPDGPRMEENPIHEEPEGLMQVGLFHHHNGVITASMCGGVLYYAPDATAPDLAFREVWDTGPCTGASVFEITKDDHYLVMPIAGVQSPGNPVYERDYVGEHDRRVVVIDVKKMLDSRDPLRCGPPTVHNGPDGFTTRFEPHNNHASDCPVQVSQVVVNSKLNYTTNGGPHVVVFDEDESYIAFDNYFVDLTSFGFTGTGSGGDHKIFIAKFNNRTGQLTLDNRFRDELTGEVGVAFNRPTTYAWPDARGKAGSGKPHAMIFVETGPNGRVLGKQAAGRRHLAPDDGDGVDVRR